MWENNRISNLLATKYPIVQAPMAGSSTPELAISVSNAGGVGSLGAAMLNMDDLKSQCQTIKNKTNRSFNVNFFVHALPKQNLQKENNFRKLLQPAYEAVGLDAVPKVTDPPPSFGEQHLKVMLEKQPGIISFHFGLPEQKFVAALKNIGTKILSTATCVDEARDLEIRGVDAIIAQGFDAGGHRGTYKNNYNTGQVGTMSLIPQIVDAVSVPVIAAGGIGDGRGIAAALSLGAEGVQMGTAFLLCPESACSELYRDALKTVKDSDTCITHAFSGRPARGIRNEYIESMAGNEKNLPDFPIPTTLTGKLRNASIKIGTSAYMSLWSGQAGSLSLELPAGELVEKLISDVELTFKMFR